MINFKNLISKLSTTDKRTALIRSNIIWSFLIKGWSGVVMLLAIPITLKCLGVYVNGVWMTIATVLLWIDSFDIGLGNGLRNKLAASLAENDIKKGRECVSTTFFMLIFIIAFVTFFLFVFIQILDWYQLLNISPILVPNLAKVLTLSMSFVCLTFIFKFVGNVYLALQLPAVNNALTVGGQTLALIGTSLLLVLDIHSLLLVSLANTLAPLLVFIIAYPVTFRKYYPQLAPSWRFFNKHILKELFSLGVNFFILQIAAIILVSMSNVIISHLTTPEMVTPYQVSYRYFSLLTMIFAVIATPFWSATTDAYVKGDFDWIRRSMSSIRIIVTLLGIAAIMMTFAAPLVYRFWVGTEISVSTTFNACMAFYFILIIISTSYSYFLFGFGILRLQIIFTTIAMISFPLLGYILCNYIGTLGIILALIAVQIPGTICNIMQYQRIINGKATGIWIK